MINAISYKILNPSSSIIILDGEEDPYFGEGSRNASTFLKENEIAVDFILNLELTGKGQHFFIDNSETSLQKHIESLFTYEEFFKTHTPFNDSIIFRENGISSNVLTLIPLRTISDIKGKLKNEKRYIKESIQYAEEYFERMNSRYKKYFAQSYDQSGFPGQMEREIEYRKKMLEDRIKFLKEDLEEINNTIKNKKYPLQFIADMSILGNCHSPRDNFDSIDVKDMKNFTENILHKIIEK